MYARYAGSLIQCPSLYLQVLLVAASVPLRVTLAGFNGAKTVALWSLDTTKSVLHHLPVKTCLDVFINTFISSGKTWQDKMKGSELIPHIGLILWVILLKLF